jgi:MFS transporter, DHA2 family, multidrug resistance protein
MPGERGAALEKRRWWGLGVICVAMFISAMDMTIVNVALPDMSRDLAAGIDGLQWVLDAFLVALAGLLLAGSGVADRFGRRKVFLGGFVGFALASVLAAASQTVEELIAARVLMGVAAACVLPPALALLAVLFPPDVRPKALGIWSAVAGLGLALGPVVGGILVDVAGWRWVFVVNVPFVLLAAPLGLRWLPESRRPGAPPLDLVGVALSTLALGGTVFALIEGVDAGWASPAVLISIAVGLGCGAAFLLVELRRASPLFDVRVLRRPAVGGGGFAILATYVASLGMLFLIPQYVQYVQQRSALASGLMLAPFGLGLGVLAPVSGRLVPRLGIRRVLLIGLTIAVGGFGLLLLLGADSSPLLVVIGTGVVGCGLGLTFPPATVAIMDDLGVAKAGDGAAVNQLARQVGGALGVAVVGSVFAAVYAARIGDPVRDLAPASRALAADSIEGATQVAAGLGGRARADLLGRAVDGFDVGARVGVAVCVVVVLAALLAASRSLAGPVGPAA